MRRFFLQLAWTYYLVIFSVLEELFIIPMIIIIVSYLLTDTKRKNVYMILMMVLVIALFTQEYALKQYSDFPTHIEGFGKLVLKGENLELILGSEHKVLIKPDVAHEYLNGTYDYSFMKQQPFSMNPNQFDYKNYMKSIGYVEIINLSDVSLNLKGPSKWTLDEFRNQLLTTLVHRVKKVYISSDIATQFIKSILLNQKKLLSKEIKEIFMLNGTSHVLAISGLHIATLMLVFNKVFFMISKYRGLLVVVTILTFLWVIGMPLSALRAIMMVLGALLARRYHMKYDLLQTLGLIGCVFMLTNVYVVYHTGFIYTMMAVVIITVFYNGMFNRLNSSVKVLIMPLVVQIGLLPLTLFFNNQIHLFSFIINLLTVPLLGIVLNLSIITLIFPIGQLVAFNSFLIKLMINLNTEFSSMVNFIRNFPSPNIYLVLFFYLLVSLIYEQKIRGYLLRLFCAMMVLLALYNCFVVEVYFFDVGQGDAILIKKGTKTLLIDSGYSTKNQNLQDILFKIGVGSLDYVMLSHSHQDHIGGLKDIKILLKDVIVITNGDYIDLEGNSSLEINQLETLNLDFISLTPVHYNPPDMNPNNQSIVTYIDIYDTRLLLTGDIEKEVESLILNQLKDIDILKVPHHGSETSSTKEFIEKSSPEFAIICVGKNNYGHPNSAVLERYNRNLATVKQTINGCVKFYILPWKIYFVKQYN